MHFKNGKSYHLYCYYFNIMYKTHKYTTTAINQSRNKFFYK